MDKLKKNKYKNTIKPISDCPVTDYKVDKNSLVITQALLKKSEELFNNNRQFIFSQNVMARNNPNQNLFVYSSNPSSSSTVPHIFSTKLSSDFDITNQHSSGRCWIFSALNILRHEMSKKYDLPQDFELSQPYIFFYNKLELMNYKLQMVVKYKDLSFDDYRSRLSVRKSGLTDGGHWDMFCNIIKKYGIVPKSVFGESWNTNNTKYLNKILVLKFKEWAEILRNKKKSQCNKCINDMLIETHRLLLIHIGTPPKIFDWNFYNKKNTKLKSYRNITPSKFYKKFVPVNVDDYIGFVNDPRHKFNKKISTEYSSNMIGAPLKEFINVPIETLKLLAFKTLKKDMAVWFTSDSDKYFDSYYGIWDKDQYNYKIAYGTEPKQSKKSQLEYKVSGPGHAMIFSGCHVPKQNKKTKLQYPTLWRVDNSWGKTIGKDGRLIITDSYFSEYVYEIVIPKKIAYNFDKKFKNINISKKNIIMLPPWDVFGSVST